MVKLKRLPIGNMESKTLTVLAIVIAGTAMHFAPDAAWPVLKSLAGAAAIGVIADLHKSKKKRK